MTIQELITKYEKNRGEYINPRYNETQLRNEFLDPFFELLSWDIKNVEGKSTNEREVLLEESLKAGIESHSKKPDYTFRLFSERKFFVEAKKPSVTVETNIDFAKQVRRYGFTARLKISVLSNFEHLLIYDCSVPVTQEDAHHKALIKIYHYSEYIEHFEELKQLLGKDSVYSGEFDNQWKNIEEQLKQFSVDNLFISQINQWRLDLGTEILKYNPELEEQNLNDVVQSYINRIIFLRVCEDRNLEVYRTLLSFANHNDFESLIGKFEEADRKYNSGLFEQYLSDQLIQNVSSVFWTIIKQLYYPESPYSFSVFSSDILGNIYEIFLSQKLVKNGDDLSLVEKPENVDKDIITTPTFIINDILRQTVIPALKEATYEEILSLKVADISCGSGALLLQTFQLLNDVYIDFLLRHRPSDLIQTSINTYKLPLDIKKRILLQCIFGIDKDYNAVEAAKFGLLLKLLEDENTNTVAQNLPILPSLTDNIRWGNSLITPTDVEGFSDELILKINPFDFADTKFDVIVGNPPYMKSEDMKNITGEELAIYKSKYESAYKQFDKYFLFVERAIQLLNDDGYFGYIIPNKFAKVGAGLKLRSFLSSNGYIRRIESFGANQVFSGNTTYTCLLILNKSRSETCEYLEVRDLTAWKVRNIDDDAYDDIPIQQLEDDGWILVPGELKDVYAKINSQSILLGDLIGDGEISNGIQTSANDIYIFLPTNQDDQYYYFKKDDREWKVEKELTRPYFRTSSGRDNLFTYRLFNPNAVVIYPYKLERGRIRFVEYNELSERYPFLCEYLDNYKEKLDNPKRDISPPPATENEWYRYGRHQALETCDVPEKIVVGVLSQGNKYAIDRYHTLISSGGTAGYCMIVLPSECPYSIYYIQALLNSKYVEWYCALIGEIFRGGYIARGTKVLKRLPIRVINFSDREDQELHDSIVECQKRLINLQSRLDTSVNSPRVRIMAQRNFDTEFNNLEGLLARLYNLGNDDANIPLIKELYATN